MTNVVSDLLAANLIKPLGEGESSGGRPPDMISFKAERGCILAVEITALHISFLLADLDGNEIGTHTMPLLGGGQTPQAVCASIGQEARRLLRKYKKSREQLLVVVVAVPAITDVDKGIVLSITTLENWRSVPLRAMLGKIFECPVIVENDTNLAALGERYRGAAQVEETFILINIGSNVSAGIVLNGNLHHGAQWSAGEIAYLRLPNISGKYPTLYEFGELESILTSSGILNSWYEANGISQKASRLKRNRITAVEVLDLAQQGSELAGKIAQARADIVADIVVNLSLILNPGLILLGGEIGVHPLLISAVQDRLRQSEFPVTKIAACTLAESAVLWGAISVALEQIPSVLLPPPLS